MHVDNKKRYLIFGKSQMQWLGNTILKAKAEYITDFNEQGKKFCLNLHYNGSSNYLFVNGVKMFHFRPKYSGINEHPQCLEIFKKTL